MKSFLLNNLLLKLLALGLAIITWVLYVNRGMIAG